MGADVRIDLHVHTTASDGTLTPSETVALAAAKGLDAIAITDHDSVEGVEEALSAAESTEHAPIVIPGVELSSVHDDRDVHILGYFVDHTNPAFLNQLEDLRQARLGRAETIVTALSNAGYAIDLPHVLALSSGGAVGRSHVARALVEQGMVTNVTEAFRNLLGRKKPFYVPKDVRTPAEAVKLIREAGGVAVLAHPGVTGCEHLARCFISSGLEGIEAYHSEHDDVTSQRCASLANELGLIVTGGSDFHGLDSPNDDIGGTAVPPGVLFELYRRAGRPLPPL
ncbi:MAG: PHP domain-containing protein [Clostridiales bacterium]|nr:PHP domain-containing protein [Clostridiales bacterium]